MCCILRISASEINTLILKIHTPCSMRYAFMRLSYNFNPLNFKPVWRWHPILFFKSSIDYISRFKIFVFFYEIPIKFRHLYWETFSQPKCKIIIHINRKKKEIVKNLNSILLLVYEYYPRVLLIFIFKVVMFFIIVIQNCKYIFIFQRQT